MLPSAKIIDLIQAGGQEALKAAIPDSMEFGGQHIGWAVAEDSLKELDISGDELFTFLGPEFPEDWESGVSWGMLSDSQKALVLSAIWKDQEIDIWADSLFVRIVCDENKRTALLLFLLRGDPRAGNQSFRLLHGAKDINDLEAFIAARPTLCMLPGSRAELQQHIATVAKPTTTIAQQQISSELQARIRNHVARADWQKEKGFANAPLANSSKADAIRRYVTEHYMKTRELPFGDHRIPFLVSFPRTH